MLNRILQTLLVACCWGCLPGFAIPRAQASLLHDARLSQPTRPSRHKDWNQAGGLLPQIQPAPLSELAWLSQRNSRQSSSGGQRAPQQRSQQQRMPQQRSPQQRSAQQRSPQPAMRAAPRQQNYSSAGRQATPPGRPGSRPSAGRTAATPGRSTGATMRQRAAPPSNRPTSQSRSSASPKPGGQRAPSQNAAAKEPPGKEGGTAGVTRKEPPGQEGGTAGVTKKTGGHPPRGQTGPQ